MLKLEKSKRDLVISFRIQDHFFTPTLLKALCLALAFHLGGFLIFQIQPFKITSSFIFPPINVQSLPASDTLISLEKNNFPLIDDNTSEIPQPLFLFPSVPKTIDYEGVTFSNLTEKTVLPSSSIIQNILFPYVVPNLPLSYHPLTFIIAGNLAQRILTSDVLPYSQIVWKTDKTIQTYSLLYQVQIDPLKGEIIWYEKKHSAGLREVDQWAEKQLLNLKFSPDSKYEFLEGEIGIVIRLDPDKTLRNFDL